jgi:TolB-like protein/AraC-like DNA-binding protein
MDQALSMDQVFLNKVFAIIEANLSNEKFGAAELSRELGISHSNINRRLRSLHKKTISQLIQEIRLQHAMEMLQEKVATASEIAFRVGFSSPSYFNKCFHDYFGFPPGEVKKLEEYDGEKAKHQISSDGSRVKTYSLIQRKWLIIALSALILILGAWSTNKIIKSIKQTKDIARLEKSIAVLPFINDSPDDQNAYFINGIMDEVLNNLQKIKGCRVLSRTSTEQFRVKNRPAIPAIAKKLDVNYLVEGSGQKYGNTFRLRVQLIAANNEKHLWGGSFGQEIQDINDLFKIQSQIAQSIAIALQTTLSAQEKRLIENSPTANLRAYEFYQRGEEEMRIYSIDGNSQTLKRAEEMYRRALENDPAFSWVYASLANVYAYKHWVEDYFSKSYLDSIFVLSNKALSYDEQLSKGYVYRGLYYREKGDMKKAIKDFNKAIKINPNLWLAYYCRSGIFSDRSKTYQDVIQSFDDLFKALTFNRGPESVSILQGISGMYNYMGFIEKAKYFNLEALKLGNDSLSYYCGLLQIVGHSDPGCIKTHKVLRKAYGLDTNNVFVLRELSSNCAWMGQFEESLKYWKKYLEQLKILGRTTEYLTTYNMGIMGYVYWNLGNKEEAEYCFNKQLEFNMAKFNNGEILWPGLFIANVYAFKGDYDKAYKYLRICSKQPIDLIAIEMLKEEPLFRSIQNEPEFQEILKDFEAKYMAGHEQVRKWLEEQGKL